MPLFYYFFLILGVFSSSTSVIFLKLSETDPVMLSAYRVMIAGIVLSPFFIKALRRNPSQYKGTHFKRTIWPSLYLASHFIIWMVGAKITPAANSTLIVMMVPIVMPFLMWFMVKEIITGVEITGTLIALGGVIILGATDFHYSEQFAMGDTLSFLSMILYAFYLASARKNRDFPSLWHYVVPLYLMGGLFCFAVAAIGILGGWVEAYPKGADPFRETALILSLGVIPTVIGHSIINFSLKHIRGQAVSIINLSQFLFAGILGVIFLQEIPGSEFYLASLLVAAGSIIVIAAAPKSIA